MRLGIDLDDVLADLVGGLIELHYAMSGVWLDREQVADWDDFPPEVHRRMRETGYARLSPLPAAREFLETLKQDGHHVFIVTYRNPEAGPVTRRWLDRYLDGLYDGLCCTGGSKVEVCRAHRVDLIVDDSPNQVQAVTRALEVPGILVTTPMNRAFRTGGLIRRADDLATAGRQIAEFATLGAAKPPGLVKPRPCPPLPPCPGDRT
ncbi:MAG: hypothetical protein GXP31_16500 [Kiritimatiellaeota bacterium]|nr:hypothetical protein [Kiritimatiellota bacterium]